MIAFAVAQRTHEIGVRIALGASRRHVIGLFLWSLRWPFVLGVMGGSVCAAIGITILKSTDVLINAPAVDPMAYGVSIVLLLFTASVATVMPAVRAARNEPWSTLTDY